MKISDLDLNLLVVFNAIYEARSISAAARELDLSQPGISHALKRLRTQLGDELFVRQGNGVAPTAQADALSGPIRNAIEILQTSLAPAEAFDPATSKRHFRFMLADMIEDLVLPRFMAATEGNRGISFELVSGRERRIEHAILQGQVDMSVHLQADMMPEIEVEPLAPIEPVLTFRHGHPLASAPMPWAILPQFRLLSLNLTANAVENLDRVKVSQYAEREHFGLVHNLRSLPVLLQHSDCVAFVPKLYVAHVAERYGLSYRVPPAPILTQDFTMNWHRKSADDPALIWVRGVFREAIAQRLDR